MTKTSIIENLPNFSTKCNDLPGHFFWDSLSDAIHRMSSFRMGNTMEKANMSDAMAFAPPFHMCEMPWMMEKLEVLNSSGKSRFMISV